MAFVFFTFNENLFILCHSLRDFAKKEKMPQFRDYYGSGCMGPGLTRILLLLENHPKIALNQC